MERTHEAAAVTEDAAAQPERVGSLAPTGSAGAVLGLQRSIGNRGAMALLRETDPRLTYTKAAVAEGAGLDAQMPRWTSPGKPDAG